MARRGNACVGCLLAGRKTTLLSASQATLFGLLWKSRNRVVRYQALFNELYGLRPDCDQPERNTLQVHIVQLRKALAPFQIRIVTVPCNGVESVGYKLIVDEDVT